MTSLSLNLILSNNKIGSILLSARIQMFEKNIFKLKVLEALKFKLFFFSKLDQKNYSCLIGQNFLKCRISELVKR